MRLPPLHVVTDDGVLAAPGFRDRARSLMDAHGPRLALHLRGPGTSGRALLDHAEALAAVAGDTGAWLFVNDRADVALAVGAGVQLGARSLPVAAARTLTPAGTAIGYSAHGADEAVSAVGAGADFVVLGTVWETPSHPGRSGAGLGLVAAAAGRLSVPVIAIGGATAERAREAVGAGAHGVAAIRGIWAAADPVASAGEYIGAMSGAAAGGRA